MISERRSCSRLCLPCLFVAVSTTFQLVEVSFNMIQRGGSISKHVQVFRSVRCIPGTLDRVSFRAKLTSRVSLSASVWSLQELYWLVVQGDTHSA